MIKKIFDKIAKPYRDYKEKKKLQKKIDELKKRDPFIYK